MGVALSLEQSKAVGSAIGRLGERGDLASWQARALGRTMRDLGLLDNDPEMLAAIAEGERLEALDAEIQTPEAKSYLLAVLRGHVRTDMAYTVLHAARPVLEPFRGAITPAALVTWWLELHRASPSEILTALDTVEAEIDEWNRRGEDA